MNSIKLSCCERNRSEVHKEQAGAAYMYTLDVTVGMNDASEILKPTFVLTTFASHLRRLLAPIPLCPVL